MRTSVRTFCWFVAAAVLTVLLWFISAVCVRLCGWQRGTELCIWFGIAAMVPDRWSILFVCVASALPLLIYLRVTREISCARRTSVLATGGVAGNVPCRPIAIKHLTARHLLRLTVAVGASYAILLVSGVCFVMVINPGNLIPSLV
mgnify:CR=1 FL=1